MNETRLTLRESLALAALLLVVGGVALAATALVPHLPTVPNLAAVNAATVVSLTNDERADEGVPVLARNALLDRAAQMKAEDMATKGYYAHVSPEGLTPIHWVEKAGYAYLIIGENLVVNRTDAEQVVDAFMGSPGHRANILRKDFTEIGVGVANGTYKNKPATFTVQIFGAPYPTAVAKAQAPKPVVKPGQAGTGKPVAKAPGTKIDVPRASASTTAKSVSRANTSKSIGTNELVQDVKELVSPITSSLQGTSTGTSTSIGSMNSAISVPFEDSAPVDLVAVSQLGQEELPVQVGSNWTMRFRLFAEQFFSSMKVLLSDKEFES